MNMKKVKSWIINNEKLYKFCSKLQHLFLKIRLNIAASISIFLKVKNNKVVVVNYYGKGYGDNPKYIVNKLLEKNKSLEIVWLVNEKNYETAGLPEGVRISKYNLFNTIYELGTAKIWIDNCRKSIWPIKKKSQIYIQTWHGSMGYKNCEKAVQDKLSYNYVYCAKKDSKMADLFISSSDFTDKLYRDNFWYDGEILKCGSPRNDEIVNEDKQTKKIVKEHFNINDDTRIVLYAPTFRKDKSLKPYDIDYVRLLDTLKQKYDKDWVVFVRLHPNMTEQRKLISYNEKVIDANTYSDMQELLVAADIVITDYSSAVFDFALSKKPAFVFATDIEEYKKDRGLIIEFEDTPFSLAKNNNELIKNIQKFNFDDYVENVNKFYKKHGCCENGTASEVVAEYIIKKVGEKNNKKHNILNLKKEDKSLAFNTVMLYIMQIAGFVFPLITFPYLTRMLGADNYGIVVFTSAVMVYFQMFIDYGFLLSGTEKCAKERDDLEKLSKTTSSIVYSKLILSLTGLFIVIACTLLLDVFNGKKLFIVLSYIPLMLTSFIPDYLFRGIEKMGIITTRTIAAKMLYAIMIFVCVRTKNNYYLIPLAALVSNLLIVIWSWLYITKNLKFKLKKFVFVDVKGALKESSTFFASRIATTAYSASNVFVLGLYGYGDTALGIYGVANNLITYGRAIFSPIADSLYPYMVKNKNHKLVRKILMVLCPLILVGCVVLYYMADFVIRMMSGEEYMEAVSIFRKMIPLMALTLPIYLYGYPMLGSINQNKKANLSVIIGAIFHIMGLVVLYVFKLLTFDSVVYLTISTETIILIMRLIFFNKYKNVKK